MEHTAIVGALNDVKQVSGREKPPWLPAKEFPWAQMYKIIDPQVVVILEEEIAFRDPIRPDQYERTEINPLSRSAQEGLDLDPVDDVMEVIRDVEKYRSATRVPSGMWSTEEYVGATECCKNQFGKDELMKQGMATETCESKEHEYDQAADHVALSPCLSDDSRDTISSICASIASGTHTAGVKNCRRTGGATEFKCGPPSSRSSSH